VAGKLKKPLADKIDVDANVDDALLRCKHQRFPITCAIVSPDKRFVFSGSKDGSIVKCEFCKILRKRWTSHVLFDSDHAKFLIPDLQRLRTRDFFNVFPLFSIPDSLEERKKVGMISRCKQLNVDKPTGHSKPILSLAISDDSKYLASSCSEGMILVWNPEDLTFLGKLKGHRGAVTGVAIQKHPAPHLYSCSADKTVKVWSLPEMAYIETLFGHQEQIVSVDCLRRERAITSGGRDSTVRIWKIPEESQLVFNAVEGNSADCVSLIDEQYFVSGDDQGTLCYWTTMKKKPLSTVRNAHGLEPSGNPRWITAVAALHNSDVIATGTCRFFFESFHILRS
jgi:ribosomal RNA-processing protein 9